MKLKPTRSHFSGAFFVLFFNITLWFGMSSIKNMMQYTGMKQRN